MKTTLIFLLAILSLSGYAQDSLLIKDVFDFNVGDIFHYYTYYAGAYDGWISEVDTLKNKSYSTNLDTVYYSFSIASVNYRTPHFVYGPTDTIYGHSNRIDKYFNLDSLIWYYDMDIKYSLHGSPGMHISGKDGCGTLIIGYNLPDMMGGSFGKTYGKGIGVVKDFAISNPTPEDLENQKWLIYYKKKNLTCNNGHITDIPILIAIKDEVKVFPNPASDLFNLEIDDATITNCFLYNSVGQMLKAFHVKMGSNSYNIGNLKPGIYFIQIPSAGGMIMRKLVKY